MDIPILASLTRLESSLTSLAESITSYAPNPLVAQNLLSADAELSASLSTLATHTSNTILLAHLHSLADNLAATYKRQISALADVRREILELDIASPDITRAKGAKDEDVRMTGMLKGDLNAGKDTSVQQVDYKTVLAFARNLSRYSAPRGFKPPSAIRAENEARRATEEQGQTMQNGLSERRDSAGGDVTMADANAVTETAGGDDGAGEKEKDKNLGLESLDQGIKAWLDPQQQVPFLPWPSDEMIARSSLARVTGWIGAAEILDESNVGAAEERVAQEEARKKQEEDEQRRQNEMQTVEHEQRPREIQRPKVYHGLDLYNPDEE